MRVLFISGSFPPIKCGVGDYLYRLALAIANRSDLEVAILTSTVADPIVVEDRIEFFPVIKSWGISQLSHVLKVIWSWKPDIVHIQYPTLGYWFAPGYLRTLMFSLLPLAAFLSGCRVVQTWHEYETHPLKSLPYFLLRALVPSNIVVVRPSFRDHLTPFLRKLLRHKNIINIRGASAIPRLKLKADELRKFRERQLDQQQRLIVFFGFVYPNKGAELILHIANPKTDRVLIAGGYEDESGYIKQLKADITSGPWKGKAELLGFISSAETSKLLSAADAVVLPFRDKGGGDWNSSLQAALTHHCFVVTTSTHYHGYDQEKNVYYAEVDNTEEMKHALNSNLKERRPQLSRKTVDEWQRIADAHIHIYEQKNPQETLR